MKSLICNLSLTALVVIALAACGKNNSSNGLENESVFVISAIPDEKITDQTPRFKKLATYLSQELGVKTEFQFSKDYTDAVQKFKNGEVHLVWLGGLSGVQARMAVPGSEAIAQGKVDMQYKSYFIAHRDVAIEPSEKFPTAIQSLSFTFGSPGSTSGRLMPSFFIMENTGKLPDDWFDIKPIYQMSGAHVATANAVAAGTVKVGALSYKAYDFLVETNEKIKTNTKVIWTTPLYADYNFTIHPDAKTAFGDDFFKRVQAVLVAAPAGLDALKSINRESIIPAKNADFDSIKAVAEKIGLIERK